MSNYKIVKRDEWESSDEAQKGVIATYQAVPKRDLTDKEPKSLEEIRRSVQGLEKYNLDDD